MDFALQQMHTILRLMDWRTLIDVMIVGAGLFFLYNNFRSSGTWKIVLGILLAGSIFVISNLLNLKAVMWIYSYLSHVTLIALIIIFQPELRRIFERAVSFRKKVFKGETGTIADKIADASNELAVRRWGAIIAFPGRESITPWLQGGTPVDARLSFPIMMSIFDPHSHGHDGAIIIEDGRISYLGVRLPLSKSGVLDNSYGTRHHAAMGLSEVTDAMVLVVSEERGAVTIFKQGHYSIMKEQKDIALTILNYWDSIGGYTKVSRKKFRWRTLVEVGLSFATAFLLWSSVVLSEGEIRESSFTVPVEYSAIPDSMALTGDFPTSIRIQVAGPVRDLTSLDSARLKAKINLTGSTTGEKRVPVTDEILQLPRTLKLIDANPSVLPFTLHSIAEKEIPIEAQLVGELPDKLIVEHISIRPERVRIFSPTGQKLPSKLSAAPIYLQGIRESTKISTSLITTSDIEPSEHNWPDIIVEIKLKKK